MSAPLADRLTRALAAGHAAPVANLRGDLAFAPPGALTPAAVLIAVTDRADMPGVLVTHRPATMRAHPGQAAFPGGKLDAGETAREAALREAWEELGIAPGDVTVIGETDRYQTGSGYDITPVLALVPADLPLRPNPHEVAEWFEPPLGYLLDAENHIEQTGEWQGQARRYLEIVWHHHSIWGVTAGIIANLSRRLAWPRG